MPGFVADILFVCYREEFVHSVLDIASVFAGKLNIPFSDSIAGKLDNDGWAGSEFPGLLQSSVISTGFTIGASGNKSRIDCEFSEL